MYIIKTNFTCSMVHFLMWLLEKSISVVHSCLRVESNMAWVFFFFFFFFINLLILFIYLFSYFWLRWIFVAARRLSPVAASGGYSSLQCMGFSLQWLLVAEHGL